MNLSYSLAYSLSSETFTEAPSSYVNPDKIPTYAKNNRFPRFLEVTVQYDRECFIPVLGLDATLDAIDTAIGEDSDNRPIKISYPLYVTDKYQNKRTADSIIQTINKTPVTWRLSEIITSKGLHYYGGQGLIFDEDWNLMMMCGYLIYIDRTNNIINIVRPECYISPDVFTENDILSKAVIKKVIPYISSHSINIPFTIQAHSAVIHDRASFFKGASVIIEPLKKWIYTTQSPYNIERLDEDIWRLLNENRGDLV